MFRTISLVLLVAAIMARGQMPPMPTQFSLPAAYYVSMNQTQALGVTRSMVGGQGGTALISYGKAKQVLVRNGYKTVCTKKISVQNNSVVCNGTESAAPSDICQPVKSILQIRETICIWEGSAMFSGMNMQGVFSSNTILNDKRMDQCPKGEVFTTRALKEKCGHDITSKKYATVTYIPDTSQANSIKFPNINLYLGCDDPKAKLCKFHVDIGGWQRPTPKNLTIRRRPRGHKVNIDRFL